MTTLYHGTRGQADGKTSLNPTTLDPQQRNERIGRFLYATHRIDQAYLYALTFPSRDVVGTSFMTTLDPHDPESALTRFREDRTSNIRAEAFSNAIYSMDSAGFERVIKNPREWFNDQPVHDIKFVAQVTSFDQVLKQGVQYFSKSDDAPAITNSNISESPFSLLESSAVKDELTPEALAKAIASNPHIVWENETDGFGVDPKLAGLVDSQRLALLEEKIGRPLNTELLGSLAHQYQAFKHKPAPTADEVTLALSEGFYSTIDPQGRLLPTTPILEAAQGSDTAQARAPRSHEDRMAIKDALSMVRTILTHYEGPMLSDQRIKSWTEEKRPSCASLILCEGSVLMCRQTGRGRWDFPKGMSDEGESPLNGALRELKEETGLSLNPLHYTDLGSHPFVPRQRMHAFAIHLPPGAIDIATLRCDSWVEPRPGDTSFNKFPEVDAFEWVPLSELNKDATSSRNFVHGLKEVFNTHLQPALDQNPPKLRTSHPNQAQLDAQVVQAVKTSNPKALADALNQGGDTESLDILGNTVITHALHQAANWGNANQKECLKLLIQHKANLNAVGASGQTPSSVAAFLGHKECLDTMIMAKADINIPDSHGKRPLMLAATEGIKDMLSALMDAGAPVDSLVNFGRSALMPTASAGYRQCVESLIKAGANLDAQDHHGHTALMAAARSGKDQTLKALIRAGATLDIVGLDGLSATDYASQNGHESCSRLLQNGKSRQEFKQAQAKKQAALAASQATVNVPILNIITKPNRKNNTTPAEPLRDKNKKNTLA
jgi:ankyrin repeat protein/8-oxo-dGTP pyrophosphatase MutT (NUDIX family)